MSEQEPQPPLTASISKELPVEQLDGLFKAIGWNRRGEEKWKTVLDKSSYVLSMWDGKLLVGMGRILEDGVMCMFYDIGVLPDYQNKGVGKQILTNLIDQVKDKGYASIGLFAWEDNPSNVPFYETFGFERQASGMELVKYMDRE